MKNNIHYSAESRRDLDDIWDYIVSELQNRVAAERVVDRILDAVERLKDFAEMGALHGFLSCERKRCFYRPSFIWLS